MDNRAAATDEPIRCISSRHLARNTAEVLDEISQSDCLLMVMRSGQPAALLSPVPQALFEPVVRREAEPVEVNPEEVDRVAADEMQRRILVLMADELPHVDVAHDLGESSVVPISIALTKLEISRLVVRQATGSYRISRRGALVAQALEGGEATRD
ncbi:MAG: hypothetical protein ACRDKB_00645 [Actinomycetota bacterium]